MSNIGLAVIGSTGVIGRVHIDAINRLDNCRLVGITAQTTGDPSVSRPRSSA